MKHGNGAVVVTQYVTIPQRRAVCSNCNSFYTGPEEKVECRCCGKELQTTDLKCNVKYPVASWTVSNKRKRT